MAPAPEEHAQEGAEPVEEAQKESEEEKEPTREFVKMTSQFVVPVVEREKLSSLVVISLSLEANIGLTEKIHAYEPKLRDMFLQVLFDHANMGGFNGAFTRSDMLTPLRTALREAAQKELGKDIHDVLIVEMSRQDV